MKIVLMMIQHVLMTMKSTIPIYRKEERKHENLIDFIAGRY